MEVSENFTTKKIIWICIREIHNKKFEKKASELKVFNQDEDLIVVWY